MKPHTICVITGTRAEYGHLYWILRAIQDAPDLNLQLVATGMHLSPEFGLTYKAIEADGFRIDAKVETVLSSDTAVGVTKSMGLGVMGFADALDRLMPDLVLVDGDRYEILAAVQAALLACIPVAHVGGGDVTEGSCDDAIRHCLTKLSHLHFPSNEQAYRRILQLGEPEDRVFNHGSPGIDYIMRLEKLSRSQLEERVGMPLLERNLLMTFHPATLSDDSEAQCKELLEGLSRLGPNVGLILTKTNSDTCGRSINRMLDEFAAGRPNAVVHSSLGQLAYLSALAEVDAVVGNSSSGVYEAPSFKTPTVNVGERQKGRPQAESVLNCAPTADAVEKTIRQAWELDCSNTTSSYGDGNSAPRIVQTIAELAPFSSLLAKRFVDIKM